jgi:hypothetical protein
MFCGLIVVDGFINSQQLLRLWVIGFSMFLGLFGVCFLVVHEATISRHVRANEKRLEK